MGMTKQDGERGASLEDLDRPSAQRISGVFPTIGAVVPVPQRPLHVRVHLRQGLSPQPWPRVVIEDSDGAGRFHALVLDAKADPRLIDRVLRAAVDRRAEQGHASHPIHPSIFLCGGDHDGEIGRLASTAQAIAAGDVATDDGLHFITQRAVEAARLFAKRDVASRADWARLEIAPWIARSAYPDGRLTDRESEVLALFVLGFDRDQILAILDVAENTMKTHVHRILQKTHHTVVAEAIEKLRKVLGPVAPHQREEFLTEDIAIPRILLNSRRTPPGGRPI